MAGSNQTIRRPGSQGGGGGGGGASAPLGVLSGGYAQVTANQGSITTEADLTGLTVTVTAAADRRIRISAEGLISSSVDADMAYLRIKESTTVLQIRTLQLRAADAISCSASVILTPSAGSHTYKLSLARAVGTGDLSLVAGATYPAFILVEDIGAA